MKWIGVLVGLIIAVGVGYFVGKKGENPRSIPVMPIGELKSAASDMTVLRASALAKRLGLRVYPALAVGEELVRVPTEALAKEKSAFLLGKDGELHELLLQGETEMSALPWGCGGDSVPGTGFNFVDGKRQEGGLVILGDKDLKARVHWSPATSLEVSKHPSCLRYKPGYTVNSVFLSTSKGLPQGAKIYTASWRAPSATVSGSPSPESSQCQDWTHEQLGVLTAAGECQPLFENTVDCDGKGYQEGSVGNLAGVIELSDAVAGGAQETWLIFEAHGYEGAAYLSVKFDPARVMPQLSPDMLVYSGC